MNDSTRMCQICDVAVADEQRQPDAVAIWTYCEASSVRRRSRRSASTPPISVKSIIGSFAENASRPR